MSEFRIAPLPADVAHKMTNTGSGEAPWLLVSRAGQRFFSPSGEEEPTPDGAR